MYETTFGFNARPFAAAPQSDCYYDSGPVESARKTIIECIERAEGPALLVGPPGVGKSLVCQKIAEYFDSQFRVVLLTDARIGSRKELLQNILFDLGLSYQDIDEGELRLSLIDFLDPQDSPTSGMLLIIDEADTLSVELLEEIRMITNLVRDGQPRVRLLLSGGPELETLFANPKLETFNQRIARRCYLHNLNEQQTAEYVRSQISGVGGNANQVFTDEAIASIFTASDGSPRFINQLCDHALLLNSVSGFDSVNEDSISEAWSDLQQLPAPWDSEPEEPAPSFIEFGELSDDSQSSAGAESNAEATPPVGDQALDQLDAIQQEVDRIVENETPQAEVPATEEPQAEELQTEELQTEVTATEEPATEE
ncbi:MAG: AAA family ATPase, partial [bacterium]|nr:AAA family ATPase [bacterium]